MTTGVDALLDSADALIDAGKYEQALELARQAASAEPGNAHVHLTASRALLRLGRPHDAANAAHHAVSLAPLSASAHRLYSVSLGKLPVTATDPFWQDQAVRSAREAVRLAPADPMGYAVLAEACAAAGHLEDADQAIRRALELRPSSADLWGSASYVAIWARNWLAAEGAARRALAIEPDNYAATNNLGVALRNQGRWTLGAVAFHDAARTDPRSPTARDNVERIGFRYLITIAPLFLLPLVIVFPLFLAARIGVTAWLNSKPAFLKPVARRIGIRVATSKRYRRRFEKHQAKMAKVISDPGTAFQWSALRGRQRFSNGFVVTLGVALLVVGAVFLAAAFSEPTTAGVAGGAVVAALILGWGAFVLLRVRRRRNIVY